MAQFIVHAIEIGTIRRSKTFDAATEEEAREMAEDQDWREWEREEQDSMNCSIDWIEEA